MPPEVAERLAEVVVPLADRLVGTEQPSPRELRDEQDADAPERDPVQPAVARERRAKAPLLEEGEHERREQDRRAERDRLNAVA
jgi:hypothetical protein